MVYTLNVPLYGKNLTFDVIHSIKY